MAVEQKPVGRVAKLPEKEKTFTAACGAKIVSSMREVRNHVATCQACKRAAQK